MSGQRGKIGLPCGGYPESGVRLFSQLIRRIRLGRTPTEYLVKQEPCAASYSCCQSFSRQQDKVVDCNRAVSGNRVGNRGRDSYCLQTALVS